MIIGRRVLIIDTPASTLDDIEITSVIARFNESDGSFSDASLSKTCVGALNHHYAIQEIGKTTAKWSEPQPLTEDECNALMGGKILDLAKQF